MNDLNQLEKQLESWIPRRPSAKIRRQLFPVAATEPARPAPVAALWLSLGAAAACVCLMASWLMLPHQVRTGGLAVSGGSNLIASLTLPESSCQQWNLWSAVTFDWTKGGSSLSITGPLGLGRTNL
jgi:hypothetical protein